mmetsp:Transcript_13613/g.32223  ORF Transcript_13613/g.32223 Transcript_13613/m.32223 type:complete len:222 (+) Transcript_13613:1706-2371(+)
MYIRHLHAHRFQHLFQNNTPFLFQINFQRVRDDHVTGLDQGRGTGFLDHGAQNGPRPIRIGGKCPLRVVDALECYLPVLLTAEPGNHHLLIELPHDLSNLLTRRSVTALRRFHLLCDQAEALVACQDGRNGPTLPHNDASGANNIDLVPLPCHTLPRGLQLIVELPLASKRPRLRQLRNEALMLIRICNRSANDCLQPLQVVTMVGPKLVHQAPATSVRAD